MVAEVRGDSCSRAAISGLDNPSSTNAAILVSAGVRLHCWFHFAVHGVTDNRTPVDGGLELTDGRLTIRELAECRRLPDARFAYLSACATYQGSPAIPDETLTVGTALCIAGCQDVIAALACRRRSHRDSRRKYRPRRLRKGVRFSIRRRVPRPCGYSPALRDAHPDQPERWAAFVCADSR